MENDAALDELIPVVYDELYKLARRHTARERANHSLSPTALTNEAYLRLAQQRNPRWENRAHFLAIASRIMRRVLVDYARKRRAEKRGYDVFVVTFDDHIPESGGLDLMRLDDALRALDAMDSRQARIVELRFFGGLTVPETAKALGVSSSTVKGEWAVAKRWLYRELRRAPS